MDELTLLKKQNMVLRGMMEFILVFCMAGLSLYDLDRGTNSFSLMGAVLRTEPQLLYAGIIWGLCIMIELYIAFSDKWNLYIHSFRVLLIGCIPSYIIYKVWILNVELYSADTMVFFIIPACQIALIIVYEFRANYESYK